MTYALEFEDATGELPQDTVPDLADVEYPCEVCGKEAGPYGGRGRKPKRCPDHKKQQSRGQSPKISGTTANQAAMATAVLVQVNGILAVAAMGMGLNKTAHAIAEANPTFEQAAHNALLTDPELCRLILKSGVMSGRVGLGLAYAGMGMTVVPTAVMELRDKREARRVKTDDE